MVKDYHLAKSLTDALLSEIIRQLLYKTKWEKIYTIATYYLSSQICIHCGYKNSLLKNLSIRKYTCPNCQYEFDRDYNVSVNIMFEVFKLYMNEISAYNKHLKHFK